MSLLGLIEELGELAHSHLKEQQGIRTSEDHVAKAKDAIGDIVIFLADYCNARVFNLALIIKETWEQVRKRDWKRDSKVGDVDLVELVAKALWNASSPPASWITLTYNEQVEWREMARAAIKVIK